MPDQIPPRWLQDRDAIIENLVMSYEAYQAVRNVWRELSDQPELRNHPNYEALMQELASFGAVARKQYMEAVAEALGEPTDLSERLKTRK